MQSETMYGSIMDLKNRWKSSDINLNAKSLKNQILNDERNLRHDNIFKTNGDRMNKAEVDLLSIKNITQKNWDTN